MADHGIPIVGGQQTKTRAAMEYFGGRGCGRVEGGLNDER